MGKTTANEAGVGEFSSRTFRNVRVTDLSIRGTGVTGKWLLRLEAEEQGPEKAIPAAFAIEFLPGHIKYCRVNMIGEAAADAACGADALLPVPEEVQEAFDLYVRRECERRRLPMRRTRQGPRYMIRQLATLIVQQQTQPSDSLRQEVERYIFSHFLERPEFVSRVANSARQYHFGDPITGRFFMTEIPAQ